MRFPRPAIFLGNQSARFGVSQDGCVDGCSVRPLRRCWPMVGTYVDMGTYAYNMDTAVSTPQHAGYAVHFVRADVVVSPCSQKID